MSFPRTAFEDCIKSRKVIIPTCHIYGGYAGLFDLGPIGTALKKNIIECWRRVFVNHDGLFEIDTPCLTPERALIASGHVERFTDLITHDAATGDTFRADNYLEAVLTQRLRALEADSAADPAACHALQALINRCDGMAADEMARVFEEQAIRSPAGNALTPPVPYNLMFKTQLGPRSGAAAYLRPETAQGMFVDFADILTCNHGALPFGIAQIGKSFRNEISPRGGLLRLREFNQAEIEYFMDPRRLDHENFASVRDLRVRLFPADRQLSAGEPYETTVGEALAAGVFQHQTMGYWVGRTLAFVEQIGIRPDLVRFRQHLPTQLAHYARDCWDCEVFSRSSEAWVECVGIADRGQYDLTRHMEKSGADLRVYVAYAEPREEHFRVLEPQMKALGTAFRRDAARVRAFLEARAPEEIDGLVARVQAGEPVDVEGLGAVQLTPEMFRLAEGTRRVHGEFVTPRVCEPSFGIDRLLSLVLDHAFYVRAGSEQRTVFGFRPAIAPAHVVVCPLLGRPELVAAAHALKHELRLAGLRVDIDASGATIGRRYSRSDEQGIPFGLTVDPETVDRAAPGFGTVTVRERDSMQQVRVPSADVPALVAALVRGRPWAALVDQFGLWRGAADEE